MSLQKPWLESAAPQTPGKTGSSPAPIPGPKDVLDISLSRYLKDTGQDHLFQAKILCEALDFLKEKGLVEAYLRGSFANGEADEYSDIDLFLVVEPENLEPTYEAFSAYLKDKYSILVSCHDKLVKDYGGIGFMYLCGDSDRKMFQFDLYMAVKGVPPRVNLPNVPRVHAADPAYCWIAENRPKALPPCAQAFIDKFSAGETRDGKLEFLCNDLMVTLSILKKHVARGQTARALNDNNHAIGVCIEMLRTIFDDKSNHSSLYAGDKMIEAAQQSGNPRYAALATALEEQMLAPVSQRKASDMFFIGAALVQEAAPELHAKISPALQAYNDLVVRNAALADRPRQAPPPPGLSV